MVLDRATGRYKPLGLPPVVSSAPLGWRGVRVERRTVPASDFSNHVIPEHTIVHQLCPSVTIESRRDGEIRSQRIEPGQVSIIPANSVLDQRFTNDSTVVIVAMDTVHLGRLCPDLAVGARELKLTRGTNDPLVSGLCLAMLKEAETGGPSGPVYIETLTTSLATHLAAHHAEGKGVSRRAGPGLTPRALKRALDYIEANLNGTSTLAGIAEAAGLSPFHFARQFRLATGVSPHQYLLIRRIDRAKELLLRGDRPIADVAVEVGFCDQSHFNRYFKRLSGMTPRAFAGKALPT